MLLNKLAIIRENDSFLVYLLIYVPIRIDFVQ